MTSPSDTARAHHHARISTRDGTLIDPLNPESDQLGMDTVFWSLATKVRFNGHLEFPWTVGLHSIALAQYVALETRDFPSFRAALLHDAAEAYLGDLAHPLKIRPEFAFFTKADTALTASILLREGLPPELPEFVLTSDRRIVANEYKLFHATAPALDTMPPPLPPYVDSLLQTHAERSLQAPARDWFRYAYEGMHALHKLSEAEFHAYVDTLARLYTP